MTVPSRSHRSGKWWRRLRIRRRRTERWLKAPGRFPGLEIIVAAIAVVVGLTSYAILTGRHAPVEGFSPQTATLLLVANLLPLLVLLVLIARRVAILIGNRRANIAGAHLHVRLTALFAALAAAPTLIVVVFASLLFQYGVQFWFSDRTRTVLDNADRVAAAYVDENKERILDDIVAMGRDISSYSSEFGLQSASFRDGLAFQVAARNLSEAAVFAEENGKPHIVAEESFDDPLLGERIAATNLALIAPGRGVVATPAKDRVEAIVRLGGQRDLFLYASRRLEPRVLEQVARTQSALSDYRTLRDRSHTLQWTFNIILIIVSLLIVATAIWFAILLASRIVAPIGQLAKAAEKVGAGDLDAQVMTKGGDEISALTRTFNRMTGQLKTQRAELRQANLQSEERRRFTEAVLAGVSAGVMSIDDKRTIVTVNQSAETLLGFAPGSLEGKQADNAIPEFHALVETAVREGSASGEVVRVKPAGERGRENQTLVVRVLAGSGAQGSFILTFDDISEQLADQRRAAWSGVARRIAHEIKNPLTPIVLSAERLKRRFGKEITSDRATYDKLTDTIVRQVEDLRRMVDEFSAFARMPAPTFHPESIVEIARQALFLAEVTSANISYTIDADPDLPLFVCDRRQLGQAFVNLIKNAAEAIASTGKAGHVGIRISVEGKKLSVRVQDTGCGISDEMQERLFEPYVTTKQKGTGLGLAIVKRIVEDHHGELSIANRPEGGTEALMAFDVAANQRMSGRDRPAEDNREEAG